MSQAYKIMIFFSVFIIGTSCNIAEVDTSNPTAFQDNLKTIKGTETEVIGVSGTIPSASDATDLLIEFVDLSSASDISGLPNISANYGDAYTSYNVYAGNYVAIDASAIVVSQYAHKVFVQAAGASWYIQYSYNPALSGIFTTKFQIPTKATTGTVTILMSLQGVSSSYRSNVIKIVLNIVAEGGTAPATATQASYTTSTTVTTNTAPTTTTTTNTGTTTSTSTTVYTGTTTTTNTTTTTSVTTTTTSTTTTETTTSTTETTTTTSSTTQTTTTTSTTTT